MIHTNRVVTVGDQESIIDKPIVLYRGDREVEVEFELVGNEFMFTTDGNVIKSINASHGQLVLNTPSGDNMFSELAECHDGKVVFVITKEMIDEFVEIGFYSFQIRLYDGAEMKSRVTIPPVFSGLDIRNPIAAEDETNVVNQAVVDYTRIHGDQSNEELPTFDWAGNYNKTEWLHHDVITENKMNKIEDAIWTVNNKISTSDDAFLKKTEQMEVQRQNDVDALNRKDTQLTNDIQNVNRTITNEVNKLKVDIEVGDINVKNEMIDYLEGELTEIDQRLETIVNRTLTNEVNKLKVDIEVGDINVKNEMIDYLEGELTEIDQRLETVNNNDISRHMEADARLDILESNKADKNEVFSMANMGQDIKEAMTGGSVAVVGDNAVLTNNIVDGQITTAKLSDYESDSLGNFDTCAGAAGPGAIWVSSKVFSKGYVDYVTIKAQNSTSNARIVFYRKENENNLYYVCSKTFSLDVGINNIPININMPTDFHVGIGSDVAAIAYLNHNTGVPMASFLFDDATDHMNVKFNVNNNANYIFAVEVVFKTIKNRLSDLEKNQGKIHDWVGKKYVALGDSITRGENSLDSYNPMIGHRYTDLAEEELGFGSVVNYGIGGSRITSQTGNSNGMIDRYVEMDDDADLICIFGGTNDFGNDVPLGEINDGDKTHFKYALNELCKGLLNKYPTKIIYFITPIHRNDHHPDNIANKAGHVLKDYVDAIKEICENYGIPVLDLWSTYGVSPFIQSQREIYIPDGLHPTPEGMKLLARKNNIFIRNL